MPQGSGSLRGFILFMRKILEFRGDYRFLSNFYVEPDGTHVEGEYQAAKCRSAKIAAKFTGLSPREAKILGRSINVREDWDRVKPWVMSMFVRKKFLDHDELAERLLATGDAELVEGNRWGDDFWGVTDRGLGVGRNELGKILMQVRAEIRTKKELKCY